MSNNLRASANVAANMDAREGANRSKLQKVGTVCVPNGKYTDHETGRERTRYNEIGVLLATPHHSRMVIKLHANGFGEGQFASVFYDKGKEPNLSEGREG